MFSSISKKFWAPVLAAAFCLGSARAQQQTPPPPPTSPAQPATPVPPITNPQNKPPDSVEEPVSPVQGSSTVVTGGIAPAVGEISEDRNAIHFGIGIQEAFDSSLPGVANSTGWNYVSNVGGYFDLHRLGRGSDLTFRYVGGGLLDAQVSGLNSFYQQFEAGESLLFRRWSLHLDDLISYLPNSSFGFQGYGVTQSDLGNVTLLNPNVAPSQSILTTQANRLSNIFLAQAEIEASQRTTFTFTGSYGVLHFMTPGYLNPTNYNFSFGYNYALSQRDTLGVSYQFNAYRFQPANAVINDSTVLVTYGHHITNRLAFQAGAGPELDSFTPAGSPAGTSRTLIGANAGLFYNYNRTSLSASFNRGVTGGAGILLGSNSDTAQVSASRILSRQTTLSGSFGYSFNASLPLASPTAVSFQSIYAGGRFDRRIGRSTDIFVNYYYYHQLANGFVCSGPACAGNLSQHQIWIGFSFDFRPVPLY